MIEKHLSLWIVTILSLGNDLTLKTNGWSIFSSAIRYSNTTKNNYRRWKMEYLPQYRLKIILVKTKGATANELQNLSCIQRMLWYASGGIGRIFSVTAFYANPSVECRYVLFQIAPITENIQWKAEEHRLLSGQKRATSSLCRPGMNSYNLFGMSTAHAAHT